MTASPPGRRSGRPARSLAPVCEPGGAGGAGGAAGWTERFEGDADELLCLETPGPFFAIGQWYADFSQTADEEVIDCLARRAAGPAAAAGANASTGPAADPFEWDEEVQVQAGPVRLARASDDARAHDRGGGVRSRQR